MNVKEIIAKNISGLRKQKGMTQAELAEKLCYSNKSISKWERADSLPDAEMLYKIAEFFGVDVNYLFKEHEYNKMNDEENRILERKNLRFKLAFVIATILILIILSGILVMSLLEYLGITPESIAGTIFLFIAGLCFLVEAILIVLKYFKYVKIFTSLVLWSIIFGTSLLVPTFPILIMLAIGIVVQSVIVVFPKIDDILTTLHKKKKEKKNIDNIEKNESQKK